MLVRFAMALAAAIALFRVAMGQVPAAPVSRDSRYAAAFTGSRRRGRRSWNSWNKRSIPAISQLENIRHEPSPLAGNTLVYADSVTGAVPRLPTVGNTSHPLNVLETRKLT